MLRYIVRRLLVIIPTLFVVVTVAFFMMRLAPGGPFVSNRIYPPEIEANLAAKYGLDQPLVMQYLNYLWDVVRGDFGPSMKYMNRTVVEIIVEALPHSAFIGLSSLFLAIVSGVSLGILAAIRQNRPADYIASTLAVIGVCVPTFVTGPILVLIFAAKLKLLPTAGIGGGLLSGDWKPYVLPIIVLTLPQMAAIARLTRAGTIEVLNSNYIRTARAKGLAGSKIIVRHVMRGALIPLTGYLGPAMAGIVTGSLVVDKVFRLPGLGQKFFIAAIQRDYTLVMGVVILSATLVLVFNLLAEILHAWMDPRVRLR